MAPAGGAGCSDHLRLRPTELEAFTEPIRAGSLDLRVSSTLFTKQDIETTFRFEDGQAVHSQVGGWSVNINGQEVGPAGPRCRPGISYQGLKPRIHRTGGKQAEDLTA